MVPDWSRLPTDILSSILDKLPLLDYIRSRCVCVQWRFMVRENKPFSYEHLFPWLMPHRNGENNETVRFVNMAENNRIYSIHLPELRGNSIIGTSDGWLIASRDDNADLQALNPITRAQIRLPPTTNFPTVSAVNLDPQGRIETYAVDYLGKITKVRPAWISQTYFQKVILHYSTSSPPASVVIVVVINGCYGKLAFARQGDKTWTPLVVPGFSGTDSRIHISDCVSHTGLFYVLDLYSRITAFDFSSHGSPLRMAVFGGSYMGDPDIALFHRQYLVGSPEDGNLLLVHKFHKYSDRFMVFRLHYDQFRWEEVNSLGVDEHVLFLGENCCLFHSFADLSNGGGPPELRGNCIYFPVDRSVNVFKLESGNLQPYHPVPGASRSAQWITPRLFHPG